MAAGTVTDAGTARHRLGGPRAGSRPRGRDSQLLTIGELLAGTSRGRAAVLVIEGPAGSGKTTLLEEAARMATRAGVSPAVARAFETDRDIPFAPLVAALADGPVDRARLAAARPGAAPDVHWMITELQGILEEAARRRPIALLLDDLHWADSATVAAVRELPGRLSGTPVLIAVAVRPSELDPQARAAIRRLEADGRHRMRLEPLEADAVAALIADRTGAVAEPSLTDLVARAHGNPYLVVELLDGLAEEGRLVLADGRAAALGDALPRRVTESMVERLDRLSATASHTVRVASVLGRRFSVEHLAAILGRPPTELVGDIDEAMRADLFVADGAQMAFRHDILRQATLDAVPEAVRRALLRHAARVLLEGGAAPVEVARQLAAGADVGDREAVTTLRRAARAVAATDVGTAADLGLRALALLPGDDAGRAPLVAETVMHLHAAGRHEEATMLGRRALAGLLDPGEEAEVRLGLAGMVMISPLARVEEGRRALALPIADEVIRARHLGWLAYNLATLDPAEARRTALEALATPSGTSDPQAHVMATLALVSMDSAEGRSRRALERITVLRGVARRAEPMPYLRLIDFFHGVALLELGRVDDALALLAANVVRARDDRNGWLLRTWAQFGSVVRYAAGRLGDARAEAESVVADPAMPASADHVAATATLVVAQVAVHAGDARRLVDATDAATRLCASEIPTVRRIGRQIRVLSALAQERPAEAARYLTDDAAARDATILPRDASHHILAARVGLAAGDAALAGRAARAAEELDLQEPGIALNRGVALHVAGLVDDDAGRLTEAADVLRPAERPLLFAAAAEDAGARLATARRPGAGLRLLDEAFEVYVASEASADARRVARILRAHGVRRHTPSRSRPLDGWGSLTSAELRVVSLVARGATNREAAEQLYLSPHTVSSHLRSAFGKLGINSRVELARLAAAAEAHGTTHAAAG